MPLTKVPSSMLANGTSGGGSSSGKNYISTYNGNVCNGDFETGNDAGWDICTVTSITNGLPSGLTVGSGTVTKTVIGINEIAGQYSLQTVFPATANQGLITNAFTIDTADQSKVMSFLFYYNVTSGASNGDFSGTSSNTFIVGIYAVDGVNAGWLQPAGVYSMTQSSGGSGIATGTFQTYSDTTQYRFAVLCANAPSGSMTVVFDDFQLGPQTAPIGAPVTDWQQYTMTITGTTTNPTKPTGGLTVDSAYWRRVGDSIEIIYDFSTGTVSGGNNGNGNYLFSLPNGLSIDYTKVKATGTLDSTILGQAIVSAPSGSPRDGFVQIAPSNQTGYLNKLIVVFEESGINPSYLDQTELMMTGNNARLHFKAVSIPISGWSSNVQMSNDTDTRVVAAGYNFPMTGVVTTTALAGIWTRDYDTHGAFSNATGRFTAPVSGIYRISSAGSRSTGTGNTFAVYKNGVFYFGLYAYSITNGSCSGSISISLNAGDYITFGVDGSFTANAIINIERLSGPSVIAANETVAIRYANTAGTAFGTGDTLIPFPTREYDTHLAWSGNTFTAPISGKYLVNVLITSNTAGGIVGGWIYKNGSAFCMISLGYSTGNARSIGSTVVPMNAGDTISYYASGSPASSLSVTAGLNHITITRIGN